MGDPPEGTRKTEIDWIHLGFDGDDEAMAERRLRRGKLVGAAGASWSVLKVLNSAV